ncbi:PREDICTED: LIM domain-containing protein PLIM2b-like isoform X2 [Lupinus angustifolius]|uniref:LIM domain-containing protein PLIM2b-like isoform X2 n=1 Tax=Lupinus angustifolius TaxID=3871 RepID=UPI00092F37CF|nr:PREDICTED: LIM domain-containing protein PLIM2b-like isoform X2 [Lupinus angustifolius]
MSFTGTLDKCTACEKTVYVVDLLTLEGIPYHKNCFKCTHCNGVLTMNTYSSMDGVLYCRTHFEQLFKESGNFVKNFQAAKSSEQNKTPSKLSSMFSGTLDKCSVCTKTVYPLEKVTLEGECFHKNCFRCAHGGCHLTHSSYAALDGVLYCRVHFAQLFMEKGNYSHVLQAAAHKRTGSSTPPEPIELPPPEPQPEDKTEEEKEEEKKEHEETS